MAEQCSQSRALYEANPTLSWDPLWREAFWHGVKALTVPATQAAIHNGAHRAAMAVLPLKMTVAVTEAVLAHLEEVRRGNIPTIYNPDVFVEMDIHGNVPPVGDAPSVGFRIDAAWYETSADGTTTAVVLFHELWETNRFSHELFLRAAALAWAMRADAPKARAIVCRHDIGKPVKYINHPPMDDAQMQVVLGRVNRALTLAPATRVGPHCTRAGIECLALLACSAWQLPALESAHLALKNLGVTRLAKDNVEEVKRVVAAMKNVASIGEARIKAFEEAME
jgi:hypothetical protein